jgi:hypothetical protein
MDLSRILSVDHNYVFWAGMILILLGIKDIFIMPLFTKIDKKTKR